MEAVHYQRGDKKRREHDERKEGKKWKLHIKMATKNDSLRRMEEKGRKNKEKENRRKRK